MASILSLLTLLMAITVAEEDTLFKPIPIHTTHFYSYYEHNYHIKHVKKFTIEDGLQIQSRLVLNQHVWWEFFPYPRVADYRIEYNIKVMDVAPNFILFRENQGGKTYYRKVYFLIGETSFTPIDVELYNRKFYNIKNRRKIK